MALLRWLVCMALGGHLYSEWSEAVFVNDSVPGRLNLGWATNATIETRWCIRCATGLEFRQR